MLTSSGQAANFFALFNICECGSHIVASSSIYGGTFNLISVTLKKMGIDVKSIVTIEKSAGKYEMKVDENIIDVRAWDKLDDVFENIKTIKELFKEKNKENEYEK